MEIVATISEMIKLRNAIKGTVGFVPTMGFLHEGHLSLVKKSRKDNSCSVVSIFVNPAQFGPQEDFANYPRDMQRDLRLLDNVGNDIVFMPEPEELYPEGYCSWVEVENLTNRLEGKIRPGHFRGVTTIVTKLFNIVEPDIAYFGQKDAQQSLVIRKMTQDLNLNLMIEIMPTVREEDGLAMSSRNVYLNQDERRAATILFRSLTFARELYEKGETNSQIIRSKMAALIEQEPLAKIDYISIADTETLDELAEIKQHALISLAVRFGKTRLIDNVLI